jgi:hypothetical protein
MASKKVDKISSTSGKAFWGPPGWFNLHVLAAYLDLDPKNSDDYKFLLNLYTKLLPCDECRNNLMIKLKKLPPTKYLEGKNAFFYSYTVHDMANQQISEVKPNAPKESPNYDIIRKFYFDGLKKGEEFWEEDVWFVIHMFATTLKPENATYYKQYLFCLTRLLPSQNMRRVLKSTLESFPPDAYLSNNHDAFFYSYAIRDIVNSKSQTPKNSQNFDDMKSFYFTGLFQECKECTV